MAVYYQIDRGEVLPKLSEWSNIFGDPCRIISDKGTAFTSQDFACYCQDKNIEHVQTTTGVARSNGQVERVNRCVLQIIAKLSADNSAKWYKHVANVQKAINSCVHSSTKFSPFELLIGVKMKSDKNNNLLELLREEMVVAFDEERQQMREEAKLQISKAQQTYKANYDKKRNAELQYQLGDLVAIKRTQFIAGKKLATEYLGPYKITRVKRNGRYDVQKVTTGEGPINTSTSCDNMKLWKYVEDNEDLSSEADDDQDGRVFVGRRGVPQKLYCDNATNFVGANARLRDLAKQLQDDDKRSEIGAFAAERGMEFAFIPPRAPHFGGLWEAAVKSAKHLLTRVVGDTTLTFEELATVLVDVEAIMNSRPLVGATDDPNDAEAITPAHLLIGDSLMAVPEAHVSTEKLCYLDRWQRLSSLKARFWSAFQRDHILNLQARTKWDKPQPNLEVGTLVLVHDDNFPPQKWLLGRVVKTVVGADGKVRVADVKTSSGVCRRAIQKLAMLPTNID
ncbi:uncharacterized protein LOC118736094 [Rhagoletis pomonella]|uniref:uncharacterized protein LOC118736094 n=1 Tax=Rhagoletis pomonella TaxID=28610 RepID=UPI0017851722|nr:uncharacterized protein LOC118736094 [Rhagoletis pomonella]